MNLQKLKQAGDLNQEYQESKKKYLVKKTQVLSGEIQHMKEEFRTFFSSDPEVRIIEEPGKVIADYKGTRVYIQEDEYYNRRETGMFVYVKLGIDGVEKLIEAKATANKHSEPPKPGYRPSEEERMQSDITYWKAFASGEIFYTYSYRYDKEKELYETFSQLLNAI